MKVREDRVTVLLPARMQSDAGWIDVTIANLSSRGLCLHMPSPPPVGSYVVVHRAAHTIVARAIWSMAGAVGLRSQDRISIRAIIGQPAADQRWRDSTGDRRRTDRTAEGARLSMEDQAQRTSSLLQFGILVIGAVLAAAAIANLLQELLLDTLESVRIALGGTPLR